MADLTYTVDVKTTSAVNSLKQVEKQVKSVNDSFGKLKALVAGVAFTNITNTMYSFARGVQQASDATGVAVTTVTNFANAVGQLGGDAQRATGDVIDFVAGLDQAKQGSAGAQAELSKVGVTLNDLATLSNEDIFRKTIKGLSQIEDASTRNSLAVKLLGKNFKDIDVRQVSAGMAGGGGANANAITAASNATKALSANFNSFQSALLNVLQPLNQAIGTLNVSISSFESLIKIVGYAMIAYLSFSKGVGAVTATMDALEGALIKNRSIFGALAGSVAGVYNSFVRLFSLGSAGKIIDGTKALGQQVTVWTRLSQIVFTFSSLLANVLRGLFRFAGIVSIVLSVAEAVDAVWKAFMGYSILDIVYDKIKKIYYATKDWLGLGEKYAQGTQAQVRAIDNMKASQDAINGITQKVVDAQRGQSLEASKTVRAYIDQNAELQRQLQFENKLIGMNDAEANRQSKMFDLETNYINQVNQLKTKYIDMQAAAVNGTEEEKAAFKAFSDVIGSTVGQLATEYENQTQSVSKLISENQVLLSLEKDRQNTIDAITQQMDRQASLGDQIRSAYDKLTDVQFEGAQMKRSPLERQFAQIQEDARKAAREASLAFASGFDGMDLTVDQAKELADGLEKIAQMYGKIADQQTANLTASRTWEQGWKDAFDSYMDNATNAATRAGDAFSSITSNMNSAIDNFVTTGKFKFGDFARSIIQDLIKIELKAQATKILSGISGGIGGFLGSIFGGFFANGGNPPIGKPSIVGENGPELFVPKTAGTIVPNGGSMPGATAGNTYITNNISAIDAKSVAQLFAENRRTLFGSVQLAQKEMSYGR